MMRKSSSSYVKIAPEKTFYVLSNLIKSAVLLSYSPIAAHTLVQALVYDEWNTQRIRNLAVLYAIPDFVSLFLVSRMAWTTKAHHVAVVLFMGVVLNTDFNEVSVWRALVVYAIFSTFAYLVNLLLALRFLQVHKWLAFTMSALALCIYVSCLGLNWLWQIQYLCGLWQGGGHRPGIALYVSLLSLVVYDDLVLTAWLKANVCKKWRLLLA